MYHPGFHFICQLQGQRNIVSQNGAGKSIFIIIAQRQALPGILRANDADNRAEALLIKYLHIRSDICEQGRLIKGSFMLPSGKQDVYKRQL